MQKPMKKILLLSGMLMMIVTVYAQSGVEAKTMDLNHNYWFVFPLTIYFGLAVIFGYVRADWSEGMCADKLYTAWKKVGNTASVVVLGYSIALCIQYHSLWPIGYSLIVAIVGRVIGDVLAYLILPNNPIPIVPKGYKLDVVDAIGYLARYTIASITSWFGWSKPA